MKGISTRLWLTPFILGILLFILKWSQLSLPCYWDEAYPYSVAVRWQLDHGISPLPSAMPPDYSTGHPTFFYFVQALWMKATGGSIFAGRLLPMLVSVLVLWATFRLGRKLFSPSAGAMACGLLFTRNVFFVQSSFMLPEMWVTLFVLLALHAWLEYKRGQFALWASLLLLTKEPGLMLVLAVGLWEIIAWLKADDKKINKLLKNGLLVSIPLAVAGLFFIVQHLQFGWMFYPRHMGAVIPDAGRALAIFVKGYSMQVLVFNGGLVMTAGVVAALAVMAWKKIRWYHEQKLALWVMLTFYLLFVGFSSLNFYISARYILCVYPLVMILAAGLWTTALPALGRGMQWLAFFAVAGFQLAFLVTDDRAGDVSPGYVSRIKIQQEAIDWMSERGYRDKEIYAPFLFYWNLKDKAPGYVKAGGEFTRLYYNYSGQRYLVRSDVEAFSAEAAAVDKKLIHRFEKGSAWVEIWAKTINDQQ